MTWELVWTDRALKDTARLDGRMRERIIQSLERLAAGGTGDVKRLRGGSREWRLRVGDWRVRLSFDYPARRLEVLRVLPRDQAYRDE